jgi:hypothetical protein
MHPVIPFKADPGVDLATLLVRPFHRISAEFPSQGPTQVTLWFGNEDGLRISSEMHDVAYQTEIGSLCFERVTQPSPDELLLDIVGFADSVRAQKLAISDEGYTIEAGVSFLGSEGAELIICAAAFPCHLFISGIDTPPQNVIPEYPLEKYSRTDIA